jgi:predicted ATPase
MNSVDGGSSRHAIRTPDQKLRVFVSSTLRELAEERRAARLAIERLHLAPVMFELGARPHPPRDLYRAYLDQSDLFVGLYAERYGWVAPGEDVSGLEDEYRLAAPGLPKLIYIRETTGAREPRLGELLDRIRTDDTASFKYFSSARELGSLLTDDLATLLAERFDLSRGSSRAVPRPHTPVDAQTVDIPEIAERVVLPVPLTALVGRQDEVAAVGALFDSGARLITLSGPGGIGKSRLAIDVATRQAGRFADGVFFVDLSSIHDPSMVVNAVADAVGVRDTGDVRLETKLVAALRPRSILLVLDNFEQIIEGAPVVARLLAAAAELRVLVTSRTLLRLSVEQGFEVGPLALPGSGGRESLAALAEVPSVALFVERVHAVKPDFELTAENALAVARICVALDGVPLALELAAARVRVLPPQAMLERLDRRLPLLVGGARDLPARQQTLRRTIEWSTQLLGDDERALLAQLGVFEGGFTLEAVEALRKDTSGDTLALLGTLVDSSLVRQEDRGDRAFFTILATVREYALEDLAARGDLEQLRRQHARYYCDLAAHARDELRGPLQREWVARLADDRGNLRATARYLLDEHEWDEVADFAWSLYIYWWVGSNRAEVAAWMNEVLASGDSLSDRAHAVALYYSRAIGFWRDPGDRVVPGLAESAELFRRESVADGEALALVSLALAVLSSTPPDPVRADDALQRSLLLFQDSSDSWGEAMAQVTIGRVDLFQQKVDVALQRFTTSLRLARELGDGLGETIALNHRGWALLLLGDGPAAREAFEECLALAARLDHTEGVAYGLEGLVALAATTGDAERAGMLLGAAEALRQVSGDYNPSSFSFHQPYVDGLLATAAAPFSRAREKGRELSESAAVRLALTARERTSA